MGTVPREIRDAFRVGILAAVGVACFGLGAAAQTSDTDELRALRDRIEALERRVDALERADQPVEAPQAEAPAPPAVAEAGDRPGWRVTLFPQDPGHPREQGAQAGRIVQAESEFTLAQLRAAADSELPQPIGILRQSVFVVETAGWHSFGYTLTFPPVGFAGLLAGYECVVDITIEDRVVLETTVRMPYGLRNRVKQISASERLQARPYRITEWIACRSDGRQSADPTAALDAIGIQTMLKRPDDRRLGTYEGGAFRVPADDGGS